MAAGPFRVRKSREAFEAQKNQRHAPCPAELNRTAVSRATHGRPRRLRAVPGVRSHRQRAHQSGLFGRHAPGHNRQDLKLLRSARSGERGAAADGRPCRALLPMHSPDRRPRNPRRANLASTPATVRTLPQPGTAPAPRQTLKLAASHVGRGGGSMRARRRAGISGRAPPRRMARSKWRSVQRVPAPHLNIRETRQRATSGNRPKTGRSADLRTALTTDRPVGMLQPIGA
jgi:hypothetical protein